MRLFNQIFILAFVLSLAACGGGGNASPADNNNSSPINTAPTANAGKNQSVLLETGDININGTASSDPENDSLTYLWELIQRPNASVATLVTTDQDSTIFAPDLTGSYRVQLTVSDGILSHSVVVDIDVANNTLPMANAGIDQDVNMSSQVILNGNLSNDPNGQNLTYSWTQLTNQCPDITGGSGALSSVSPQFTAPAEVCTLVFDLRVNDGTGDSSADRVMIQVMENSSNALFVDPTNGDDVNSGSRSLPMLTIQAAIDSAESAENGADIYVMQGTYSESVIIADNVSLYGGYSTIWERDRNLYISQINTGNTGISGVGKNNLTIDGLRVVTSVTSNAGIYGVILSSADNVNLTNNIIISTTAASGSSGLSGSSGSNGDSGFSGLPGSCDSIEGAGGAGGFLTDNGGGDGGTGGLESTGSDGSSGSNGAGTGGGLGGSGGSASAPNDSFGDNFDGASGGNGARGQNGANGNNGSAAAQMGTFGTSSYTRSIAANGLIGIAGSGGGGGGGGGSQTGLFVNDGGGNGGGGGGSGGNAGMAGEAGESGGGSFGVYLFGMTNTNIANNAIQTASGGNGGNGGGGGAGGGGGDGGPGATVCTTEIGSGGNGGIGGDGGNSGHGGAGSGGPSIGIAHPSTASSLTIKDNTFTIAAPSSGGASLGNSGVAGISQSLYLF